MHNFSAFPYHVSQDFHQKYKNENAIQFVQTVVCYSKSEALTKFA